MTLRVLIADEQTARPLEDDLAARLQLAVQRITKDHGYGRGEISIAVVDDATIRELNRHYLQHDWATDVITFPLEAEGDWLEGEIVVSRETADRIAADLPWTADDELLLYAIHGALHLVGLDDQDEASQSAMKAAERQYLMLFDVPHADSHA